MAINVWDEPCEELENIRDEEGGPTVGGQVQCVISVVFSLFAGSPSSIFTRAWFASAKDEKGAARHRDRFTSAKRWVSF